MHPVTSLALVSVTLPVDEPNEWKLSTKADGEFMDDH